MSRVSEWFIGDETVQRAREAIDETHRIRRDGKGVDRRRQDRYEAAVQKVRRHTRKTIVLPLAAIGSLVAGGAGIFSLMNREQGTVPITDNRPIPMPEGDWKAAPETVEPTQRVISEAENGLRSLYTQVQGKIATISDPFLREGLESPFEFAFNNQQNNPSRNLEVLHMEAARAGKKETVLNNPSFFYYQVLSRNRAPGNASAAFSAVDRTVSLADDFNGENMFDVLQAFHELGHASHDTGVRQAMDSEDDLERYQDFYTYNAATEKPRMLVGEECTAYAMEIELLDLYLDGRLSQEIQGGVVDIDRLARELNIRPEQQQGLAGLIELARAYYPDRISSNRGFSSAFVRTVSQTYQDNGYELYTGSLNSQVVPFRTVGQ